MASGQIQTLADMINLPLEFRFQSKRFGNLSAATRGRLEGALHA
jgi:hypothetical protein